MDETWNFVSDCSNGLILVRFSRFLLYLRNSFSNGSSDFRATFNDFLRMDILLMKLFLCLIENYSNES